MLDVRESSEVAAGAIAGSHAIPLGYLTRHLDEVPRDRPQVVYCQSGTRSAIAASLLAAAGFSQVLDLAGGFDAWQLPQHGVPVAAMAPSKGPFSG